MVVGYAEESWPQLLRDFVAGRMQPRYDQSPHPVADRTPHPRSDLLNRRDYTIMHTIEATQGRPPVRVLRGAQRLGTAPAQAGRRGHRRNPADGPRRLLFLDLNLIAEQDYAKELFCAMIPLKVRWGRLATHHGRLGRGIAGLDMLAATCQGLLIGFETLSPDALRRRARAICAPTTWKWRRLHARGIAIRAPSSSASTATPSQLRRNGGVRHGAAHIDLPRYAVLTPFPGAPLRQAQAGQAHPQPRTGRSTTASTWSFSGAHEPGHAPVQGRVGVEDDLQLRLDCQAAGRVAHQPAAGVGGQPGLPFLRPPAAPVLHLRLDAGPRLRRPDAHRLHPPVHDRCAQPATAMEPLVFAILAARTACA
ncbi:MAG: hypothetical protein R2854_18035 [Caldilineaceae bacterium]